MLGDPLLCLKMADFLNIFAALEQHECEITSCTIPDSNDDIILLAAVACFMRRELTRVNGYFEVTIPAYLSGEFENHFRMTRETCQLLTQELMTTGRIPTGNSSGAANNFARKTDTAVPLECGQQGALSYDRRPFWGNYEQCLQSNSSSDERGY